MLAATPRTDGCVQRPAAAEEAVEVFPRLPRARRRIGFRTVAHALLFAAACPSLAADLYKPIQLIAQQPPGSQSEAISRIWAECASEQIGQPVVVISRPGANGVIAANYVKLQPADGYTIMTMGMSQIAITPYLYRSKPYDPEKDFDGVAVLATSSLLLVASTRSGIKQFSELATRARNVAGGLNYGSPGKGSPAHLLTATILTSLDAGGTHVPYVGEAAGVDALLRGDIDIMTLTSGTAEALTRGGRAVPLAIYSQAKDKAFPDVPTIVELTGSTDLARPGWLALVVKAGTPPKLIKRLREVTAHCARSDLRYQTRLSSVQATPVDPAFADVKAWTDRYTDLFRPLITQLKLAD